MHNNLQKQLRGIKNFSIPYKVLNPTAVVTEKPKPTKLVNCDQTWEFLASSRPKLNDGLKGLPDPTP